MSKFIKLASVNLFFDEEEKSFYPILENGKADKENKIQLIDIFDKEIWKTISFEDKQTINEKLDKK